MKNHYKGPTIMKNKHIHILGGGTLGSKALPHLSLTAPAYGATAKRLAQLYQEQAHELDVCLHLTKMAGGNDLETNQDVEAFIDTLVADTNTKIIVMNMALCDFDMTITRELDLEGELNPVTGLNHWKEHNKAGERIRLSTKKEYEARLVPAKKIINKIRKTRKDIFLVGFKTTFNASLEDMFQKGLTLMKTASCNLVLVNDIGTYTNFIITPEESSYSLGKSRDDALKDLVEMSLLRSHLSFTRSTVVDAEPVPWEDPRVPSVLRGVVNHCIEHGAYKEGPTGATVGHFAVKLSSTEFLTSRRKVNFNRMAEVGLVRVKTDGPDSVIAYGSKPSVGGQSQRIVFQDHQGHRTTPGRPRRGPEFVHHLQHAIPPSGMVGQEYIEAPA